MFHKNVKAFALCAGFFSLVACREKSVVGPDLVPPVDNIHTFRVDNLPMTIREGYFDSLWTNDYLYPVAAIGRISSDAFFGKTSAGVYMQVVAPSAGFSFGAGASLDSAFITVPYLALAYGDTDRTNTAHSMHLKAYQITGDFAYGDGSRKYYAMDKVAYNTTAIGEGNISIKSLTDSLKLGRGDSAARNLMRLPLKSTFATAFMANDSAFFGSTFLENFKGIYLGPDTTATDNTIGLFRIASGNTTTYYSNAQMEFYYHSAADTAAKLALFPFNTTNCAFFNGIYRNYNGTPAQQYLNNLGTADRDSLLIQGYPGFYSDITVQIGTAIPASIVNKAALVVTTMSTGDHARFSAPPQLVVKGFTSDGIERNVLDMLDQTGNSNTEMLTFVGGGATSVTIGGVTYTQYVLNIPREVQRAVTEGRTELKLRLLGSAVFPGAFRMLGTGMNGSSDTRLKLDIIYTKTQ